MVKLLRLRAVECSALSGTHISLPTQGSGHDDRGAERIEEQKIEVVLRNAFFWTTHGRCCPDEPTAAMVTWTRFTHDQVSKMSQHCNRQQ